MRQRAGQLAACTAVALFGLAAALVAARVVAISQPESLVALAVVLVCMIVGVVGIVDRSPVTMLTGVFLALFLIPENYVLVGPLKSVGNPALLGGFAALGMWGAGRVLGLVSGRPSHPMRWTIFAFILVSTVSLSAAMMRPLTESESAGATRAIFPIAAMLGIALLACDGLGGIYNISHLLQRVVLVGGAAAAIGITEFFVAGFNYRNAVHLPLFTTNTLVINDTRSGFDRVDGAAAHPIEYSVALATLAPLALHFALHGQTRKLRQASGLCLGLIFAVIPLTVSRSGLLAIAVGLLVYGLCLSHRARLNLAVLGVIGLAGFAVIVPGLIGTLRSLVTVGTDDPSISGRTEDYAKLPGLMEGHWVFGRGLGTFQPDQYFYLDNQYLGSLLEGGLIGLAMLVALFVGGMGCAKGAGRRATGNEARSLGRALMASVAALASAAATYDELSFHQSGFLLALLLGCIGALWSRAQDDEAASPARMEQAGSETEAKVPLVEPVARP